MTGRSSEPPCVVPTETSWTAPKHPTRSSRSLCPTVAVRCGLRAVLILNLVVALAAPGLAATPPVPKSRPKLAALHAPAVDAASAKGEAQQLGAKLATRLRTLNRLLAKTGLDLNRLVAEAATGDGRLSEGQGGPLVPAVGRGAGRAAERAAAADLDRLRRMQSVLLAVPIAAPMREYKLNSGFGYRRDPFRRRGALHTGLDFGGPRNAPIMATAPGRVIEAGRSGAYGIMVVFAHGMGIETR